MKPRVVNISPAASLWLLAGFLGASVLFIVGSFLGLCLATPACQGAFFQASLCNITVFNSEPFCASPGGYAALCIMYFLSGVGLIVGFVLFEVVFMPVYTKPESTREIFGVPPALVFAMYTASVVLIVLYYSFCIAPGPFLFLARMGVGVVLPAVAIAVAVLLCDVRFHNSIPNVDDYSLADRKHQQRRRRDC